MTSSIVKYAMKKRVQKREDREPPTTKPYSHSLFTILKSDLRASSGVTTEFKQVKTQLLCLLDSYT